MQLIKCNERPDCCHIIQTKDEWIMSLMSIKETNEYKKFIEYLNNNTITEESLVKYAKYHLELKFY